MGDETTNQKKRMVKWAVSYSSMSKEEAEKRLGVRMKHVEVVPTAIMLANAQNIMEADAVKQTKERVYQRILEYLQVEGYPTEVTKSFKEANINDLIFTIVSPVLFDFIRTTGRVGMQLEREREIISVDGQTGGTEEFVVVEEVSLTKDMALFIVEAKRSSVGAAMKQVSLTMKDARDNNGGGVVYGFSTTGETWQMLTYNGEEFLASQKMDVVSPNMGKDKDQWMKDNSELVDCLFVALSNGGIVKDVVVG